MHKDLDIDTKNAIEQMHAGVDIFRDLHPSNDGLLHAALNKLADLNESIVEFDCDDATDEEVADAAIELAALAIRIATEGDAKHEYDRSKIIGQTE